MKFGVAYHTAFHGYDPDAIIAYAKHAEDCGFESFFMPEHVVGYLGATFGSVPMDPSLPFVGPLQGLGFVAAATGPIGAVPSRERYPFAAHDPAPTGQSQVDRIAVSRELATNRRAQAIRSDQQIARGYRPVPQLDLYLGPVVRESADVTAQTNAIPAEGRRQRGLKISAVNEGHFRAISLRNRGHRILHELAAAPVTEGDPLNRQCFDLDAERL